MSFAAHFRTSFIWAGYDQLSAKVLHRRRKTGFILAIIRLRDWGIPLWGPQRGGPLLQRLQPPTGGDYRCHQLLSPTARPYHIALFLVTRRNRVADDTKGRMNMKHTEAYLV